MAEEQPVGRAPRRCRGTRRGRRSGIAAGIGLALLSLVAGAGAVGAEGEGSEIWERLFRGSATVDVVNLEVRVHDERGRPVLGLEKDDFEVLVAGRPVSFDNFFAVEPSSTARAQPAETGTQPPARLPAEAAVPSSPVVASPAPFLAIYIDHANLSERDRSRVLGAVRELLDQVPGPLRGTVLANERDLVVHQPVTSSRQELLAALERVETSSALRERFEADRQQILVDIQRVNVEKGSGVFAIKPRPGAVDADSEAEGPETQQYLTNQAVTEARSVLTRIRTHARQRADHSRATLEVLRGLVAAVGGLPGRKAVLVLTGGLPLRPGAALYEAYSRRFEALSDVSANFHSDAEAARDDATPELERLLEEANASRVSFYVLDAAFARSVNAGSAETGHILGGTFHTWDDGLASLEQHDAQAGLRRLGRETGGAFAPTPTSWSGLFDGMFADTESYYSLGIPGRALAEGESQRIEVRVRGRDLEVRHPATLRRRTLRERASQATSAALTLDAADDPLGIVVAAEPAERLEGGTYRVPLSVRIPLDRIVLLPGATEHTARVWMLVAVRDAEGRTSEVAEHVCPIRIPNGEMLTSAGRSAACGVRLEMRAGAQRVAVTVLDEAAGLTATALHALDVGAQDRLDATR